MITQLFVVILYNMYSIQPSFQSNQIIHKSTQKKKKTINSYTNSNKLLPKTIKQSTITQSKIESSKPHRMKYHMIHIKSLRRRVHFKVSPNFHHSPIHSQVLPRRYPGQDCLQVWNVIDRDFHGERFPIDDIAEWWDVVVGNQDRNAAGVNGLDNSWTGDFVAAGAEAELALPHHVNVRDPFGEVLVDLNVLVLVLPLLDQNGPYWAVKPTGEEGQNWAARGRWTAKKSGQETCLQIDFWE